MKPSQRRNDLEASASRRAAQKGTMSEPMMETLEPRMLLSVAVPSIPGTASIASIKNELMELAFDAIPEDVREALPARFEQDLLAMNSAFIYQAFPGETNNVRVFGELANSLIMLTESSDVAMIRLPPAISPDVIKSVKLTFTAKGEGGGSFVGHIAGGLGLNFEGLIDATFKNLLQLPKVDLIAVNDLALTELIPGLNDLVDTFNGFLDFDIADFLEDDMLVIPSLKVPKWVPLIGGVKIFPGWSLPIPEGVEAFLDEAPTSLRDIFDLLPDPVGNMISAVEGVLDFLQGSFSTTGITISTLDGNDTINLSTLTGLPQTVIAGTGNDTIMMGGGQNIISSWGVSFYDNVNDKVLKYYGDEGNDTFIINPNFYSRDTLVDGGEGSDRLVINGTPFGDIIRLVAGPDGSLKEIRFEGENENAGSLADEVQLVALPSDTIGGSFKLTLDGVGETAPILWNAPASAVKAAFVAIGVDSNDVSVSDLTTGSWAISFTNGLGNTDLPALGADGSSLERQGGSISVAEVHQADSSLGADEVQRIVLPGATTDGTFKLKLDGYSWTAPIQHDASPTDVRDAILSASPGLTTADIEVHGESPIFYVTFTGVLGHTDQPMMQTDGAGLAGGLEMDVVETTPADPGTNEHQRLTFSDATAGTFTMSFSGGSVTRTTVPLRYDATAYEMQTALEDLGNIGVGNVVVTGDAGGPWTIEFTGDLANQDQPLFSVDISGLTFTGGYLTTLISATPAVNQVQTATLPAEAAGGTFELWFGAGYVADSTGPLAYNASAGTVQAALEAMSTIGSGNVSVTKPSAGTWLVEFTGDLGGKENLLLGADGDGLRGGLTNDIVVQERQVGAAVNEVQRVQLPVTTIGGTFTLTFEGNTTGAIAHNASDAAVKAALAGLAGVSAADLLVSGGDGGPWDIEFTGSRAAQDQSDITADGSALVYTGGTPEVTEDTKGNDGSATVVLTKTVFSDLIDVESIQINGGDGSDTLIIDNTAGPIVFSEGIQFSGGGGMNKVVFEGDPAEAALSIEHTSSKSTHDFADGQQLVIRSSSSVYDLTPMAQGASMTVKGSSGDDLIELVDDGGYGKVTTGGVKVYFQNKPDVTIGAGGGDDQIRIEIEGLGPTLSVLRIDGGSSVGDDSLLLAGSDADDLFSYSPTTPTGGMVVWNGLSIDIVDVESLEAFAGGNVSDLPGDSLVFNANNAQITPDADPGSGVATGMDLRGRGLLDLVFSGIESTSILTGDVVVIEGSNGNDYVTIEDGIVTVTNLFGGQNSTDVSTANALILNLLGGGDEVYIGTGNSFINGMLIDGGDPTFASDIVSISDGSVNVRLDFVNGRVDWVAGGGIQMDRVEELNLLGQDGVREVFEVEGYGSASELRYVNLSGGDVDNNDGDAIELYLTDASDEVTVTPQGVGSTEISHSADVPTIVVDDFNNEIDSLAIIGGGNVDAIVVQGTFGDDNLELTRARTATAVLKHEAGADWMGVKFDGFTILSILSGSGNDLLVVNESDGLIVLPSGVYYDGGTGNDLLKLQGDAAVDMATYNVGPGVSDGMMIHSLAGDVQTILFTGLEPVVDLVPGPLTVNGTNTGNVITYGVGTYSGTADVGGIDTAMVSVDNYETIEFGNKDSLTINGLAGADTINLNNESHLAGLGSIVLDGGADNDTIIGSAGGDVLLGGGGDDTLRGEDGNDELIGGEGDDALLGGFGDDLIDGQSGSDALVGGPGNDTAQFIANSGPDQVHITSQYVQVNTELNTIEQFEFLTLTTNGDRDTVAMDVDAGFVPNVNVETGDADDEVFINLANPAPATTIFVDGGPHDDGDSAIIKGDTGNDQFTQAGMVNVFGLSQVILTDIEDVKVLEGRRIDADRATVEINKFDFVDADGNKSFVRMSGPGSVDIYRDIFDGRTADIYSLTLIHTDPARSAITVGVRRQRGTDDETSIGSIVGEGTGARMINASKSDLVGAGIQLSDIVGTMRFDDIHDGADIMLGGQSGQRVSLQADVVGFVDFFTGGIVSSSRTSGWAGGTIQGSVLQSIYSNGTFAANLVNQRQDRREYGIKNVTVRGGDLMTNLISDRVGFVKVNGGDAFVSAWVTSDAVTLAGQAGFESISVTGGNLLGAGIQMEQGTLFRQLNVKAAGKVGGNVLGEVNVSANVGTATVGGNVETTGWNIAENLAKLTVRGMVSGDGGSAAIRTGQDMGAVSVGAADSVDFLAGISPLAARKPTAPGDFVDPATIGSFRVTGMRGQPGTPAPRFMRDSNVAAASFGDFRLLNVDFNDSALHMLDQGGDEFQKISHKDTVDPALSFRLPGDPLVVSAPPGFINII